MVNVVYLVFFFVLDFTNGIPSYCHNYYSEFSLHEEYNKNIDPELNMTISEKSYLYNIVEVRINVGYSNYMNKINIYWVFLVASKLMIFSYRSMTNCKKLQ